MEKQTIYPVCPHRNVAAAFECFFGPDSRSLDRFQDRRVHRAADALAVVRAHGQRAFAGAARGLHAVALAVPKAVTDLNLILTLGWISAWISATWASAALAWTSKFLLYQARVWLPRGWRRGSAAAAVLGRRAAQLLRRTEGRYSANPQRQLI